MKENHGVLVRDCNDGTTSFYDYFTGKERGCDYAYLSYSTLGFGWLPGTAGKLASSIDFDENGNVSIVFENNSEQINLTIEQFEHIYMLYKIYREKIEKYNTKYFLMKKDDNKKL